MPNCTDNICLLFPDQNFLLFSKISSLSVIDFWKKTKLIWHSVSSGLKFRLKASSADTLTGESWLLYERGRPGNENVFEHFQKDLICLKNSRQILNRRDFAICISRLGNVNNLSECIYWTYCRAILPGKAFLEFIQISEEKEKVSLIQKKKNMIPINVFSEERKFHS